MKFQRFFLLTIVFVLFLVFGNTTGNGNFGPSVQMSGYSFVRHCPDGWMRYKLEKCFKLFTEKKSWEGARKMCENEHSILASVHSFEEIEFLRSYFLNEFRTQKEYAGTWIGGFKVNGGTIWTWLDYSLFDFADWQGKYPPTDYTNKTCVAMATHHTQWTQDSEMYGEMFKSNLCHLPYNFICQKYQADVHGYSVLTIMD